MSNFALRIQACQSNFSDKERQLATFLLKNQSQISHATISELSQKLRFLPRPFHASLKIWGLKIFRS